MKSKKSPKVDLEKRKIIFLEIGFVLALSICFFAFEWQTENVENITYGKVSFEKELEPDIKPIKIEQPKVIEPKLPVKEKIVIDLKIVDNTKDVEDFKFDSEANDKTRTKTTITFLEEEKPIEILDPIDWYKVEDKPLFPGGDAALLMFIKENVVYPKIPKELGIDGKVLIQFVIDQTGRVTNVVIAKGVDPDLDAEALRVIKLLPNWIPGKQCGKPVPVTFVVPIKFTIN